MHRMPDTLIVHVVQTEMKFGGSDIGTRGKGKKLGMQSIILIILSNEIFAKKLPHL